MYTIQYATYHESMYKTLKYNKETQGENQISDNAPTC